MGAFKLGKMTFGSLFKKPETVLYPNEEKPKPLGLKGHIVIDVGRCIVCGMCDRSCSTDCITVDRKARTWEIDPFGCVQCGYCVTVCPKDCLIMDPSYFPVGTEKASQRFEIPEQPKQVEAGKAKPASKEAGSRPSKPAGSRKGGSQDAPRPEHAGGLDAGDEQLQVLLGQMDAGKAQKVRAAMDR